MFMRPDGTCTLSCYIDSEFGGLYGSVDTTNAFSVKSRTGY